LQDVTLGVHRFDEHALRTAEGPDGAEPAFTKAVVIRSARNAEKLGGLVDSHAATELRLKMLVGRFQECGHHRNSTSATDMARWVPERLYRLDYRLKLLNMNGLMR
jgi:hypothetical protein